MANQRSPNYPAIGLSEAMAIIKGIYDKEKRTAVPAAVLAKAIGYNSLSGPARVKLAALKKYGLLEGDDSSGLKVSPLAMNIMFASDPAAEASFKLDAALKPELFKALHASFKDASDDALRSHLITRLGFSPSGTKQVMAAFRETLAFSGLDGKEYNASSMPDKNQITASGSGSYVAPAMDFTGFSRTATAPATPSANTWTWTLSMPRNVKAELRIAGDATRADIGRLRKQIEFLEESFEDGTEQ